MLRNITTTYLARFAGILTQLLLLPFVAGRVGSEAYGVYALTVAFAVLFQQDLGMGNATTRFVAVAQAQGNSARVKAITGTSAVFYMILTVAVGTLVSLCFVLFWQTFNIPDELQHDAVILAVLAVGNVIVGLATALHRQLLIAMGRLDAANLIQIVQAGARVVLTMALLTSGMGIVAVGMVDTGAGLVCGASYLLLQRRLFPQVNPHLKDAQWSAFRQIFSISFDLLVISLSASVIMQAGSIVSAQVLSVAQVALYAVAQRAYTLVKEVTNSLSLAVLPAASANEGLRETAANAKLYVRGTELANMLMCLVAVPVFSFMPLWLNAWVGPELAAASVAAQVLVVSLIANTNHLLAIPVLTAKGKVRSYAVLHAAWAVSGTFGCWLLGTRLQTVTGIALGIVLPIIVLEPIYVKVAINRLDVSWKIFARDCLARPFPLAICGTIAFRSWAAWSDPRLLEVILVSLGWILLGGVAYLALMDSSSRNLFRSITAQLLFRLKRK